MHTWGCGRVPADLAAKFCEKHGLLDEYIPQIAMFVEATEVEGEFLREQPRYSRKW